MKRPPVNPTPRPYLRVTWIRTLRHVGGGKRCGGDNMLRVTMKHANGVLVHLSKSERYRDEGFTSVYLQIWRQYSEDCHTMNTSPDEVHQ